MRIPLKTYITAFLLSTVACSFAADGLKIPVPAIEFNPRHYVCYRADGEIIIDGKMDEQSWAKAEWTEDFQDIEGPTKPTPRFRTRAKMLWDENYFYILAQIEEPHVWAKLKKRDSIIFYDNDFEVFIDPDGDTHRYYELEINAFSTEWDLFLDKPYRDDTRALFYWDIGGLRSAVHVDGTINDPSDTDQGWTLEIAYPWKPLKECANKPAPPRDGDQWRVNFSRVEWQVKAVDGSYEKVINPETQKPFPEDNWVWSPQGVINMHYPEMWGFVQFSEKPVGSGKEPFVYNSDEDAKWALRRLYYQQRAFHETHGHFTTSIKELGLEGIRVNGYVWPPSIEATTNLFEATISNQDGSRQWTIVQDGRVWQRKSETER